jgi:membrane protease YdiL (CAAX protease family)
MKYLSSNIKPEELFSRFLPTSITGRVFNFPLARIIVIALFLVPVVILNSVIVMQVIANLDEPLATWVDMSRLLITMPLIILSYRLYCQTFEKRDAVEVSFGGAFKQWGTGALVAVGLVLSFVALIALIGEFHIVQFRPVSKLLNNFLMFSTGSLLQEMVLLCVIYRLIEELAGSWISLFLSLMLFAGVHLFNEAETLATVSMLMLSSVILIAPFILTRRIWVSWGFHAAWNFMQAGVFGMPNSGILFKGWMVSEFSGPEWITGGAVGLEATYLSIGFDFLIGVVILSMAMKAGKLVAPKWKRSLKLSSSAIT